MDKWDIALEDARQRIQDPQVEDVMRRRKASKIVDNLEDLLQPSIYNLLELMQADERFAQLFGVVNANRFSHEEVDEYLTPLFEAFRNELAQSLLNQEYGELYDKALRLVSLTTEYFASHNSVEKTRKNFYGVITQDRNRFISSDGYNLIHYTFLTREEYLSYIDYLQIWIDTLDLTDAKNLQIIFERLKEEVEEYYGGSDVEFDKNEQIRSRIDDPKENLIALFEMQKDFLLSRNYDFLGDFIDKEGRKIGDLIKVLIEKFYEDLLDDFGYLDLKTSEVAQERYLKISIKIFEFLNVLFVEDPFRYLNLAELFYYFRLDIDIEDRALLAKNSNQLVNYSRKSLDSKLKEFLSHFRRV